jgi:hypothetical protein
MILRAVFVAAYLFGPRYGVIDRLLAKRRQRAVPANEMYGAPSVDLGARMT